jgi:hypothetical protein
MLSCCVPRLRFLMIVQVFILFFLNKITNQGVTTRSFVSVQFERLENLYFDIHHRIHNIGRPLKLIYEMKENEIMFAWVSF